MRADRKFAIVLQHTGIVSCLAAVEVILQRYVERRRQHVQHNCRFPVKAREQRLEAMTLELANLSFSHSSNEGMLWRLLGIRCPARHIQFRDQAKFVCNNEFFQPQRGQAAESEGWVAD